jgi:hypothetical protein
MNCGCGREISDERSALGFKVCLVCGERFAQQKRPVGYMHYGHKTAGSIVLTTKAGLKSYMKVSHRQAKGSHMGYASRVGTSF